MTHRKRIVEGLLSRHLRALGGVLLEGPRACGKTTTAKRFTRSERLFALESVRRDADVWLALGPELLFEGEAPMLLDEWQRFPAVWDAARREIDRRSKPGQFLLTASAKLSDPRKVFHSGAGRISRLRMRPMTLWESGESNGTVSLRTLFEGEREVAAVCDLSPEDLAFALCRGGWPEVVERKDDKALEYAREYLEESVRSDLSLFDGVRRDPERLRRLLRLLARNLGQATSNAALLRTWKNEFSTAPGEVTLRSDLKALEGIFLIEELPAWLPRLIGYTARRTSALRHFADPSIAAAALGLGPDELLRRPEVFSSLFWNLALRDLRVFADALDAEVYQYRDKNGLVCDAVLERRNRSFALVNICLGGFEETENAASRLGRLARKLHPERMHEPAFRMVLTAAGQYAYRQADGVFVVPIGCLRP